MLVAIAIAAPGCGRGGASNQSTSPSTAAGTCTLAATNGLRKMSIGSRTYHLYVPRGVNGKVPLLVSLHGTGANGTIHATITHWTEFADSQAFVAAFPDGLDTLWFWGAETSYDVDFVFSVIADIRATGCVDTSRIFVDGWSEGAFMAQRMACANGDPSVKTQGIVIAAVHGYAGGNPGDPTCGPRGHPTTPAHVLLSQGLDDSLIDPQKVGYPAFAAWVRRDACLKSTQPVSKPQHASGCLPGSDVAWWPIAGQGHLVWSCSADLLWHDRGVWSFFTNGVAPTDTSCP